MTTSEEMLSAVSEAGESLAPKAILGDIPFTSEAEKILDKDADKPIEEIAKNALSKEGFDLFMSHMEASKEVTGPVDSKAAAASSFLNISLTDTHVVTKVGGIDKAILISDFLDVLANATKRASSMEKLSPIQMPSNVLSFAGSDKTIYLNTYHPGGKKTISHIRGGDSARTFEIAFPNMILFYTLAKHNDVWNVNDVRYFVTPKKIGQLPVDKFISEFDPRNGIYRTPFPNFYDDGRMCYGGNSMPSRQSSNLRGLDYYYNVIFLSHFNDDLGVRGVSGRYEPRGWFEHLATLETFPYELLRA